MDAAAFSIVSIGTSADGLEARPVLLRSFLTESDTAFVGGQHFDPNYVRILTSILSKTTTMTLREKTDGVLVRLNRISYG